MRACMQRSPHSEQEGDMSARQGVSTGYSEVGADAGANEDIGAIA